jgi:hypothetical protein
MSTRNLPGGTGRPARKADKLTATCEPIVYKIWEPRRLTTLWAFLACYGDSLIVYLYQTANFGTKILIWDLTNTNKNANSYITI